MADVLLGGMRFCRSQGAELRSETSSAYQMEREGGGRGGGRGRGERRVGRKLLLLLLLTEHTMVVEKSPGIKLAG